MPDDSLKLNSMEALMHLVKGNVGTGIFAMGEAVKSAGIIVGPLFILIVAVLCVHCMHLLTITAKSLREKHGVSTRLDFAKTLELSILLGPPQVVKYSLHARKLVNYCIIISQIGFCCVYFIFITDNVHQVADYYGIVIDLRTVMAGLFVPVLLPCLVRNLKYLVPISIMANIFMFFGIFMVIGYAVNDLPPFSKRRYVGDLSMLPLVFGTAVFCFEGIALVLPIKTQMRVPHNFSRHMGVLNVGMTFVAILFVFMGFIGYWKWGEEVLESVTLNLPQDQILYQVVKLLITAGVLFTYCLQLFLAVEVMWPFILEGKLRNNRHPVVWELLFRSSLVLLTFILAQIVPFLSIFISFVGSFCAASLCLLFPVVMDLLMNYADETLTTYVITKDSIICCFCLLESNCVAVVSLDS
ncbi:unnamed protein product [Phyllotreta striolata]|uniref:Amino acid transporter transmembrane domain-containing protein n=1 Tax=Phyllotreta striolata TaxID=444603 RepID=A0A9N9TJ04_PHYSR|nr:unnamed protein product [Phyllotreta striolata]